MATYHPVTLEKNQSKYQIKNLLKFLNYFKNEIIIFSSSNSDNEADIIHKEILNFVKLNDNAYFFNSLGNTFYYSLMKIAF